MIASLSFAGVMLAEDIQTTMAAIVNYAEPQGEARAEVAHPIRAAWTTPHARGGAQNTLALSLTTTDSTDGEAFARIHDLFAQLMATQKGDLILAHLDGTQRTYENAVFTRYRPQPRIGTTCIFILEWLTGPAAESENLTIHGDLITITLP
jgi:hypothetical protein